MSPDGTTTDAPGSAAARSDTHSSHPIGGRTNGATNTAIGGQISAHKAITAPNTVMIPITGATAMFAAIVTTLKVPAMAPTNGAVTTNAAPETAVISENQRGQPLRRSTSTHTGAMITSGARRSSRQRKSPVDGQLGHHDYQNDDGGGKSRQRLFAPTSDQTEQAYQAHHRRRVEHSGDGPRDDNKGNEGYHRQSGADPWTERRGSDQQQNGPEQNADVGAGHRGEDGKVRQR